MKDEFEDKVSGHETSWNKREKKSPLLLYVLLAAVCLILAYVLSGTAK
jgi:hypothetical protein